MTGSLLACVCLFDCPCITLATREEAERVFELLQYRDVSSSYLGVYVHSILKRGRRQAEERRQSGGHCLRHTKARNQIREILVEGEINSQLATCNADG